jgi:hypothetical protein
MNKELKKAIVNYMFDNSTEFQLLNATTEKFRAYIYDADGEYLIGGQTVGNFISEAAKLIRF